MKTRILLTVLMIVMIMGAYAQKSTMTLTFTADNNGQHVPLNSILIENLTQGGDTTLFAPDTMLVMEYVTGIGEDEAIKANVFRLFQNYPNPMKGQTTVTLYLPERENVLITISNVVGKDIFNREYPLDYGKHSFTFFPGKENLYFLTARTGQQSRSIKMFNSPSNAYRSGYCKLEYNGQQNGIENSKSGKNLNNFVFNLGDQLQFTASSALGESTTIDSPSGDQTYTFQYGSGAPCAGMPTVTDIDGNVYNTVQIGSQCWMKENLKTTSYQNGSSIPNVTGTWGNLTTGAYVWYENDISWKDSYGALYNWYAAVDLNGLCPTGWHVPTNDEWTALTDYIGGTSYPHGNELKSCRQVNSPLGGGCNTSEYPRWEPNSSQWGTDDYGFSGLPGGLRYYYGYCENIGYHGGWWSSTEYNAYNGWYRELGWSIGHVVWYGFNKQSGFSVRCLRD